MIDLAGYAKVTCGTCSGTTCEDVELNTWLPFLFQQAAEQAGSARIGGFQSTLISHCLCDAATPAELLTEPKAPLGGGGTMAWWYDSTRDQLTNEAWGFVFHRFTLEDPNELSASRTEKLRPRARLVEGQLLAEMVVEAVGLNRRSTRALFNQVKMQLEHFDPCCGRTVEVYEDCCSDTGPGTDRRLLTDVSEFHVTPSEDLPVSDTGTVFSVVFAANPDVSRPDEQVVASTSSLGTQTFPTCPATTEIINETQFIPKDRCLADIELQTDGSLKLCPVDYDTFNPLTCFLDVREVRASTSVTDPCPLEVNLTLTGPVPVVTPLQPDLWQTEVLDKIISGDNLDCTNPPRIRSLTVRNPDYKPDCPDCPSGTSARACAEAAGLIIDEAGFIDLDATFTALEGGTWPGSQTVEWDYSGTAPTLPATMAAVVSYIECMGRPVVLWSREFCNPLPGGLGWDHERITLQTDGSIVIRPEVVVGTSHCNCIEEIRDIIGMSFSGVPTESAICGCPGADIVATAIPPAACGPGDAEFLGTFDGRYIAANADLTKIAGTRVGGALGDISSWDVATLTRTDVHNIPSGSINGVAINHNNDEVWTVANAGGPFPNGVELFEDGVSVGTLSEVTHGVDGFPVWDLAGDRMLLILAGVTDDPQPAARTDFVVYTWEPGGIVTEIDSEPIPLKVPLGTINAPGVWGAMPTPQGGVFFACSGDQSTTTFTSGLTALNYWHPVDGFTFGIEFNIFFGDSMGVTPFGDFVYWNSNTSPVTPLSINENELSPSQAYNGCSPDVDPAAFAGSGAIGPGFVTGLASLEVPGNNNELYLITHEPGETNDCGDLPDHCFPTITIDSPAESGPCVTITIGGSGAAAASLSPQANDLSRAKFEFAPCSAISTPLCPGVIPPDPQLIVDTVLGTAVESGWTLGFGWPAESTGAQYDVITVDGQPNNQEPSENIVPREVLLLDDSCPSPFAPAALARIPAPVPAVPLPVSATVSVASATGLSPDVTYRPEWSLTAGADLTDVHVFLWSGPGSQAAPGGGNLDDFVCGGPHSPTAIKEILNGRTILYGPCGLQMECPDGTYRDALSEWVDSTSPWVAPTVFGAESAYLVVFHSGAVTPALNMVPVGAL